MPRDLWTEFDFIKIFSRSTSKIIIRIVYSRDVLKSAKKLPKRQQMKLAELLEIVKENPFNSFLHTKLLTDHLASFYSFRITRDWRVIFQFISPDIIKLVAINHRKDIYK